MNLTVKVGADIEAFRSEMAKVSSQTKAFSNGMAKMGGLIAGAFTVSALASFGKEVFNTTAKFQKFEAVLTNTLGDKSAAMAAMQQITDFAAKTPYGVDELTASFVKLANQGFVPTIDEMRRLGDLAASQGKTFDQLTEAIIDAQTGEFERLKEFGVRASKEGDKVSFTFKGVKEQVDFTSDSIRQYILSLGNIAGVSGGMEAQSKTLGGGLSNLEDSFEQLKLAIGEAAESGGLFSMALDGIAAGVKGLTNVFKGNTIEQSVSALEELYKLRKKAAIDGDIELWSKYNSIINAGTEEVQKYYDAHIKGQEKLDEIRNKKNQKTPLQKPNADASMRDIQIISPSEEIQFQKISAYSRNLKNDIVSTRKEIKGFGDEWVAMWAKVGVAAMNVQPILNETFTNMAIGFGEALGNMAAGLSGMEGIWAALLSAVGSMCTQLGQLAISTGMAIVGIKKALMTMNPYLAIAAGVALVALGAYVNAKARSIGSGSKGGGGGFSGVDSGGRGPSSSTINQGLGERVQIVEFKLKGKDLVGAMKNQERADGRVKFG